METAGKQVDDEEMRDLMKDNGIGRPSTRAAIIETLFKRKYIVKEKKNLFPTITGIQLIDTIGSDLLKSVELTGLWEKKLRQIEKGEYLSDDFMHELKQMVSDAVIAVKREQWVLRIESVEDVKPEKPISKPKYKEPAKNEHVGCPRCGKGTMVKGKSAWGCSEYKNGCKTLIPFELNGIKIGERMFEQLVKKRKTTLIKGIELDGIKQDGFLKLDENFELSIEIADKKPQKCPKCNSGEIVKGRTAYGCANYKQGCRFLVPFEWMGKKLTDAQIEQLIEKGKTGKISGFKHPGSDASVSGILFLDSNYGVQFQER
jgi:DNA topoisomerase-3